MLSVELYGKILLRECRAISAVESGGSPYPARESLKGSSGVRAAAQPIDPPGQGRQFSLVHVPAGVVLNTEES